MSSGILFLLLFSSLLYAQPDYNFGIYASRVGPDRAVNTIYRYSNVKPGIDGLVTIKALVNCTIDSVDRNGIGHIEALQPSLNINANSNGYVEFEIQFVTTGTSIPVLQSVINVTSIDVDGSSPITDPTYVIYEQDQYNFSPVTPAYDYDLLGGELAFNTSGPWFTGANSGGREYLDIDTIAKQVMFTMIAQNTSSFLIRMGADNQNAVVNYRLRSIYFKRFEYPNSRLLPVKLENFIAVLKGNIAELSWSGSAEVNLRHFEIEASTDGRNFSTKGIVQPLGNSGSTNQYKYQDDIGINPAPVIYYRLKSVDLDGKFQLSEIRVIVTDKKSDAAIRVFPNPFSDHIFITMPIEWQGRRVDYEIINPQGMVVQKSFLQRSNQTETIWINGLQTGLYFVKLICSSQTLQQKILKY